MAQGFALLFYLFFDSLSSLYVISAMFGLFQGGIVPSYAIIVREVMPAREAGTRVGIVIFASVMGMFARRLDLRRDLRCHLLLRRGISQRARLERAQCHDRGGAIAPRPARPR